nr:glycosyltransferase family 2 protein [Arthrobacter sp. zg-Y238]
MAACSCSTSWPVLPQCAASTAPWSRCERNPAVNNSSSPTVSVVITTVDRRVLLRHAVRAALAQDYAGEVEVLVVFDRVSANPLDDVQVPPGRTLTVMTNHRSPGLAGARNTGILAAGGVYVGFCDDDDAWERTKLSRQLAAWSQDTAAVAIGAGLRLISDTSMAVRTPPSRVGFRDLLRSRVTAVHSSSLLYRRADLTGRIGLVDETLPASYGEDYDLLLRATRFGHVRCVQEPLVLVRWGEHSMYAGKWEMLVAGLTYLLRKFPEFSTSAAGTARIAGQVAFAHAALGHRSEAWRWARSALRRDPAQVRAYAAVLVATGAVSADTLLAFVQKRGRGV